VRILFITSYYPPSNRGWGYMQLCEEVADGLAGLAMLPGTLAQRRQVQRIRRAPDSAFLELCRP